MKHSPTPSQTVGPFLHIGLDWGPEGAAVVAPGTPGAVTVGGRVLDGAGDSVCDALIETWQNDGDFSGLGRCPTGPAGEWQVVTRKPGPSPAGDGGQEAPHLDISVFARGLLHRVVTRLYFPDEPEANASDPVLCSLHDDAARATLVAAATGGGYRLDIHLQGPEETVFFRV